MRWVQDAMEGGQLRTSGRTSIVHTKNTCQELPVFCESYVAEAIVIPDVPQLLQSLYLQGLQTKQKTIGECLPVIHALALLLAAALSSSLADDLLNA
jgi:hypothetical protein